MIKRIFKSFTFYFILLSILLIYMERIGQDSKHIVLIGFNIILDGLYNIDGFREFMNSGPTVKSNTILGETSIYLYIGHLISFIVYGLCFDSIKKLFIKLKKI